MMYLRVTASLSLAEMGLRRRVTFFRIFGATMLSSLSYTLGAIRNVEKKKSVLSFSCLPPVYENHLQQTQFPIYIEANFNFS